MSEKIENPRVLVVDPSTAMLHVLKNFSDKHGYEADCFSVPADASNELRSRFQNFESDYRCMLLGWPEGSSDIYSDLLALLASTDQLDLPIILLCHEITTEIKTLVKRRANTRVLLWKDYQSAAQVMDRLAVAAPVTKSTSSVEAGKKSPLDTAQTTAKSTNSNNSIKTLILDTAPSICRDLKALMESSGYSVTVVGTVEDGRKAIESEPYDLVVTDFFLRGEGGEEFCRYVHSQTNLPGRKPMCLVLASKSSDAIVKRSLAVGALSCLYKGESTELLFARINALAKVISSRSSALKPQQFAINQLLEILPEPALLLDNQGMMVEINSLGKKLLDDNSQNDVTSNDIITAVCRSPIKTDSLCNAGFLTASGCNASVDYVARKIDISNSQPGVLISLKSASLKIAAADKSQPVSSVVARQHPEPKKPVVASVVTKSSPEVVNTGPEKITVAPESVDLEALNTADVFRKNLTQLLNANAEGDTVIARHSVLLLDIQLIAATGDRLCIGDSKPMLKIVEQSLGKLYTRENSFSYLGQGQFGFLLATRRHQDALVLTRKLLQLVPGLVKYLNNMSLVTHGAVLQLDRETAMDAEQVISKCRTACTKARNDDRDNAALVMPMNKYLTAQPAEATHEHKVAEIAS